MRLTSRRWWGVNDIGWLEHLSKKRVRSQERELKSTRRGLASDPAGDTPLSHDERVEHLLRQLWLTVKPKPH